MGHVIHLHRIRAALRLLLAARTEPGRALDRRYLQPVDTAIDTLRAHADKLPTRHRRLIDVLLDPQAPPSLRSHALDQLDHQLRLSPTAAAEPRSTAATVLRHPTRPASTRLFDPDGSEPPHPPRMPSAPHPATRADTTRSAP